MQSFWKGYNTNEKAIGALRIFTGGALFVKGFDFMMNMHELYDLTAQALPYSYFLIAHLIVFAHVVGGACLCVGLLTRISAACNIPIIFGAIVFVHAKEGLFGETQGLELTVMLLVVLSVLASTGSRFLSMDTLINNNYEKLNKSKKLEHYHDGSKAA